MSESQQALLDRAKAQLFDTLYDNPEHGMAVKRAVKAIRPDIPIAELAAESAIAPIKEQMDGLTAALAKITEQRDSDATERANEKAAERLAQQMSRARDNYKLTEDGLKGMTDLMREKGIMDPDDAAQLYVARQPKPALASQRAGRYGAATYADVTGFADQEEKGKMLLSDPFRFQAMEIEEILGTMEHEDA